MWAHLEPHFHGVEFWTSVYDNRMLVHFSSDFLFCQVEVAATTTALEMRFESFEAAASLVVCKFACMLAVMRAAQYAPKHTSKQQQLEHMISLAMPVSLGPRQVSICCAWFCS